MNWKLISTVALAGTSLAFGMIELAADAHLKKLTKEKAIHLRSMEEAEAYDRAKKQIELYDDLKKRETNAVKAQVEGWKRSARYEDRRRDIYASLDDELDKFKASIGYDIKKQGILDTAENELEAFKESIDFDNTISDLEEVIREAESKFDSQKDLFDAAGSDISETATELKLAAEKAKNKAVSEAKDKIGALKAKVETEKKRIDHSKQANLQKLEAQVLNEKSRLQSYTQKELGKLERQFEEAKDDISHGIENGRTPDELEAIAMNGANKDFIREQTALDSQRADNIYAETPHHECVAEWLKAKECPRWCVIFVSALPLVPLGYLTGRYIRFVALVVKAM